MGSKSSPSPPPAPNPFEIAAAEAQYNRINQFTPFGSLQFFQPGREPQGIQQSGFIPGGFSPQAAQLFQQPQQPQGGKGGGGAPPAGIAPGGFIKPQALSSQITPFGGEMLPVQPNDPRNFMLGDDLGGPMLGGNPGMRLPPGTTFTGPGGQPSLFDITGGGGNASASAVMQMNPAMQQLFNARLTSDANAIAETLRRQGEFGDLPELTRSLDMSRIRGLTDDFSADRRRVEDAIFSRQSELLGEAFGEQEDVLRARMANQGLDVTSEAGAFDLGNLREEQQTALSRAALDSIIAGGAEQSRLFELQRAGRSDDILTQLQDAQLGQSARGTLVNELAQVLGLQQVQTPGLQSFFQPSPVNVGGAFGLQQQALQNNFNAQTAANASAKGGLAQLGGALGSAAIFASDRRIKNIIRKVGEAFGVPWYTFEYLDKPGIEFMGVIAQELQEVRPELVRDIGGILHVDYGGLIYG